MTVVYYFCQFWGLLIQYFGLSNTQKQWLSSSATKMDTLPTSNNFPWLVSIDETCQGIILNHWWILSTVNCLTKLKYLTSDTSKVINKEGILHGDKICLHPSINPRDGKYTVKEIIGVIRLQFPIRDKEISVSQSYNIFRKTCFNCLYKHCRVYQYQNYSMSENNIKKLSVKFLDNSFCHHQHNHMPKSNKLCIWIHQKEDCLIQQGSPVLCIFGSHWEVVGLVSESSMTCDNPILVIKTAPYLSWMRWFIKTDQKSLDSIFPLLCNFYPGIEDDLGNNVSDAVFASHGFSFQSFSRLVTSSQSRLRWNLPPFIFVSNNKDSFEGSEQHFQDGYIYSASKFSTLRPGTTPMFKTLGVYNSVVLCNNPISSHSEYFIHSETSTHPKAYISSSIPQRNAFKNQNGISGSGRYWTDLLGAITGFHRISINAVGSLIQFSKQIDRVLVGSEIFSLHSQTKSSIFPSLSQFAVGSWLEISPDIRALSQTHAVPYETETVIWSPFDKEINQAQTYYVVEKITTGADVETYSVNPLTPFLISKVKLSTHSMLKDYGYQYSSATPRLNALFNRAWYLMKFQSTSTKSDGKIISSISKSNLLCSTLTIPFSLPLPTDNPFMSWANYKQSKIIESSKLHIISPLNKHETNILKPQEQIEDILWPFFYSNVKPLIYSKINFKRQWIQTASDTLKLLTFSETESGNYLDDLKSNEARLWLQAKNKEIKFQKHPKFQFDSSRIKIRESKIKCWMKERGGTITSLDQAETQTIAPWNQPESSRVGYWYWSNSYHTLLKTQQDVKTSLHFTYLDVDIASPLARSAGNTEHLKKSESFRVRSWIHTEGLKIPYWTKSHTEENEVVWFHVQTRRVWHQSETQMNNYLSKMQNEKILPWYQSQIDIFKTLIKTKFPILPSWTKHEGDQPGLWTQSQNDFVTHGFQNQMKTISQWTQPITQAEYKGRMSEKETSRLWKPSMLDELRNWMHHEVYTVKNLDDLDVGIIKPRVHKEAKTLIKWRQAESSNVNSQTPYETDRANLWNQDETPIANDGKDLLQDITPMNSLLQELNDWTQSKIDRLTRWSKTETPLSSLRTLYEMDKFTQSAISKSSNINLLIDSIVYIVPSWTKSKPTVKSKSISDTLILWAQTKIPATSLWTQSLRNKPKPWLQYELQETNNWMISESDLTSLCPKAHYGEINSPVKFKGEIITIWAPEEYHTLNLWKQIEVDITTKLTYTESSLGSSCTFQGSYITIFNQVNSSSGIYSVNPDYDEIATWLPSKTLPVNPWIPPGRNSVLTHEASGKNLFSEIKYDTDIPWFHTDFFTDISLTQVKTISELVLDNAETVNVWTQTIDALEKSWTKDKFQILTSFTEMRTDSFIPLIQTESPISNTWSHHVSDKINLWTQAIHPTGYQLTESIAPTVTVWLKSNPLLVNIWLQEISDRVIMSLPQAEHPPLILQSLAVTYTVISQLLQAEYSPINLWRKPVSDIVIVPWNQPELFNQKTHLASNTRMRPWPEHEQIPEYLWILPISDTLIPQWPQHESPKVNMVSPVNFDALIISTPPWPQKHASEMNPKILLASDKKTTVWSQSEYSTGNMLILPMYDRVKSRSQYKSLSAYLQKWTIFDTMVQSCPEDKYTLKNQWSHILSGAISSSWYLDAFQATNVWEQLVSGEFIPSRILISSPEVNPWDFLISDTISWPESKYLPVNRGALFQYNEISPSWPELPLVDLITSSVSDIIIPHWLQKASSGGNLWTVTPTWIQIESPILSLLELLHPNPEPSNAFSTRNILPNCSADIITGPWNHTETPWIFHVSVISPLRQTEFQVGSLWPLPLSDTVIPLLTHLGSLPLHPRTLLLSDFITSPWTLPELLPSKLWKSPIFNRHILSLLQTESIKVNTQTLFMADTFILPWTPSTHQTLTTWTEKIDNIVSQWTKSEVIFVQSQIQSVSDINQNHLPTPAITHWTHVISDHGLFRNQDASSAMYFWKKYGVDAFAEWASSEFTNTKLPTEPISDIFKQAKISTTDIWTNFETNSISQMSQFNSWFLNLWTHIFRNTVTSLYQSVSLKLIPWAKFHSSSIKIRTQAETPVLTHWAQSIFDRFTPWVQTPLAVENPTVHITSTEPLRTLTDIKIIKSGKQSTTEMVSQMITDKSSTVNFFSKFVLDNIFLSDHTISPIESRRTQTEVDALIWTQYKSLKTYIQTNPYPKFLTKWEPSEFSEQFVWTKPEAGKAMVWQQGKSKSFNPRIGDTAKIVKVRTETESSVITYFAKLVANSLTTQIQMNFLAMNVDTQPLHGKFRTNANYPLTKSWIKEENSAGISEKDLVQPATEILRLCIYMVYSTFNYLLQRENVVTVWSQVEPQQIKFPWEKTKLLNIIPWTQSDSPSIYPCINNKLSKLIPWTHVQYIPEYHLADSKAISWMETETFLANIWRETTFSKVIYWTKPESLSVMHSTRVSIVIPWIQREFPQEDIWIGYTAPKVIQLVQEESALKNSESMELRSTTINKRVWPSYNPIILAHSKSSEVFLPMKSVSETFTPLTWNDFPLNSHWAQPVSNKIIPWTKVLYIPENLWTEVVYSTFVPRIKFISSSEIIPIQLTYDELIPWAKDKISEITCILSDYHECVSRIQSWSLNSVLIGDDSYIVTKTFQAQSSLDLLAPTITTKFTTWRLDELLLLETELKPITSILVAWTPAEVSQNLIAETSKTIGTSLNSTIVPPVQFYIQTETDKGPFLTVTLNEAKKILTVSNITTLIVSVHAPTYVTQHSTQIRQTSFLWAPTETLDRNTWSFSELDSLLSWKVPVPLITGYELHHKPKYWFKTKDERIKPWTQSDFQIINIFTLPTTSKVESYEPHIMGMHSATGVFNAWSQSETESIRFWNVSKDNTLRPWFQIEDSTDNARIQLKSNTVKVWPQAESEVIRLWTKSVSNIPLSQAKIEPGKYLNMSDINAILSWFQFQKFSTRQRTRLEHQIVNPWIQQELQIAHSWNELEIKVVKTRSDFKTDASQIILTYSKSDEIKLWTQPESQLVRRWPEDVIFTLWSLTKNDAIKPWPELEYETTQSLAQLSVGIINPCIQCEASTETLNMISWIHFDTIISYSLQTQIDSTFQSLTQIYAIRQWSQPEYETTELFTHSNVGMIYPWIQYTASTETLNVIPWTHYGTVISYSLQTQIDSLFQSLTQIYSIRQMSHPEFDITKYLAHPNVDIIKPWTLHEASTEILRIIPWANSDTVISYPLQTEIDSTFQFLTQIYAIRQWSQEEYETKESTQTSVGIAYPWVKHKGSTETLEIISWTYSNTVIYPLQTQIDFTLQYLPQNYAPRQSSQSEYETTRSLTQTNGYKINPWIQHKASTETLKIIFWTHSDVVTSCSMQTLIDSFRFGDQFQPKPTQIWNPTAEQFGETSVLTEVGTVTPSFQFQDTLLRKESILMPPSQPGLQDKHSIEPQSKINVSLSECHLSMIWKDNLQVLWLYKTTIVDHKTTECGLRPGLVSHCPNCWEAEIGEFPWIVSVQLSYSHFCAGSILNERWILTSARCANFVKRSEALALVQVGLVDLQDPTQGKIVGIHHSMPYLGPSGPLGPGLIFLKEPLHFQPLVLPICLEESQQQERHIQLYDCWLPSWSLMRGSPGILQKRHLSIMEVSTCAKFWPQLKEFTFCVEAKKAMGESGCKGDLGAPLVCHLQHKDTWVQMGILIHFDENCKKPYVFSHISPFIFWLQRVTQPSHAPWPNQRPVPISVSNSFSVFTKRKVSTFISLTDSIHPHYISLSQPQALADHISLQYTMPWQALIFSCGNQICSGSIISSYWILTSAYCVRHMNPKDTVVILGLRNPGTPLRVVKVTAILLHEQFQLVNQVARNDLALVLLQESQSSIYIVAPLGNIKNRNNSECWLSGPQILKQGDIFENPEMLQVQVMGVSNCAYLYPDIEDSTVCYTAQARGPEINMESVSPGSTVMCRPLSGNGKWRQIGFTSLKHLATLVSPHFSWILSSTAKAGYPLNPTLTTWVENLKSSSLVRNPTTLLLYFGMAIAVTRIFIL